MTIVGPLVTKSSLINCNPLQSLILHFISKLLVLFCSIESIYPVYLFFFFFVCFFLSFVPGFVATGRWSVSENGGNLTTPLRYTHHSLVAQETCCPLTLCNGWRSMKITLRPIRYIRTFFFSSSIFFINGNIQLPFFFLLLTTQGEDVSMGIWLSAVGSSLVNVSFWHHGLWL